MYRPTPRPKYYAFIARNAWAGLVWVFPYKVGVTEAVIAGAASLTSGQSVHLDRHET